MKLHKELTISGVTHVLVKNEVRLDAKSPGRATFTIQATAPVKGLVTLDIGYNDSTLQRHFIGYVERCSTASSTQQVLFCRELAAILANPLPLNLRHVDLRAVLVEIGQHTGLRFRVPEQPYASVKAPFFYSLAAGYQAMDSLARVFNIPDFIGQQQGDGEVFVGSWADSFFGVRSNAVASRARNCHGSPGFLILNFGLGQLARKLGICLSYLLLSGAEGQFDEA